LRPHRAKVFCFALDFIAFCFSLELEKCCPFVFGRKTGQRDKSILVPFALKARSHANDIGQKKNLSNFARKGDVISPGQRSLWVYLNIPISLEPFAFHLNQVKGSMFLFLPQDAWLK